MSKAKDERNGYVQADKLRKARRKFNLSAAAQALFYELLAICNEDKWPDQFNCSNLELCSSLDVQEKALIRYRLQLIEADLLFYRSGKNRKAIGSYSFFKKFNGSHLGCDKDSPNDSPKCKKTSNGCHLGYHLGCLFDSPNGTKKPDNIDKHKRESKTKINTVVGNKKLPTKKSPIISVEYWQRLVDTWFEFYKSKFEVEPTFNPVMAKNFKSIILNIKKLGTADGTIWSEEFATRLLHHFLNKAYGDKWLKENFLLTNLYSKFDSIVQKTKTNEKQPTGGAVNSGSILAKINSMPD